MLDAQITAAILGIGLAGAIFFLVRRDHLHGPFAAWWLWLPRNAGPGHVPCGVIWLGKLTGINSRRCCRHHWTFPRPAALAEAGCRPFAPGTPDAPADPETGHSRAGNCPVARAVVGAGSTRPAPAAPRRHRPVLILPMRVLHVGKYYAPQRGGIERHLQELAEWSVTEGDTVAALVHRAPGHWRSTRESLQGVDLRRVGCLAAPLYTPIAATFPWQLRRALKDVRPELLHLHLPNPSCFAALLSPRARSLPWLVHWHADVPPDMPDWRFRAAYAVYSRFERAVLARAQVIVATSQAYADASAALSPWKEKVRVVPLGIGAASDAAGSAPVWPSTCTLKLLSVGRLSHYKGHSVLLEATARLPGAHLVLIGHGEEAEHLRALATALGIQDRISFVGDINDADLIAAYAAADLFVLPSLDRSEAFGLVLLEAMRAGLPIVASDIAGSGVGHVVEDGVTGLLVPPGEIEALAAALRQGEDPLLRERLGKAGQARWLANFTLDRSARAIQSIYRQMTS